MILNKRIFLGFSEVANVYTNLVKGFEKLEIDHLFITYGENIRGYNYKDKPTVYQLLFNGLSYRILHSKGPIHRFYQNLHVLVRLPLFIKAIIKYDVFIFNYNSSFFGLYDLPILKLFNKKIIYCYFGSDGRAPYLNGNYILEDYTLEQVYEISKKLSKKNKKIEKYADYIISDPNYSQFFSSKLIDFLYIGIPMDLSHIKDRNSSNTMRSNQVRIVHAPSTKKQKGSEYFSEIIDEIKVEGYDIDYIELNNVPNKVVLEKLLQCDFVLDELYSDSPMAGLATEAAYFGKPAIVGGYADFNKRTDEIPPSMYVDPTEIKNAIIKLIEDEKFRVELGKKAKEYVSNYRTPEMVASRFIKIINGDIPDEWFFDASSSDYIYGWGVSKEDLRDFLRRYLDKYGREGLFLEHNPKLADRIEAFAEGRV